MRIILLTGQPGVGKTTVTTSICEHYYSKELRIQGITTREVRERGQRVGFKITDIATGVEGWLARKDSAIGPRIGPYHVISGDLERIGVTALDRATEGHTDLVIVDEIGPMEMTSLSFRNAISRVLGGERPTVATVKFGSQYSEVEKVRAGSIQLEITRDNREKLYQKLIQQIDEWIEQSGAKGR